MKNIINDLENGMIKTGKFTNFLRKFKSQITFEELKLIMSSLTSITDRKEFLNNTKIEDIEYNVEIPNKVS